MSKVYSEEFRHFLGDVVKGIIAWIEQEEADHEVELSVPAKDLEVASANDDGDGDDDLDSGGHLSGHSYFSRTGKWDCYWNSSCRS